MSKIKVNNELVQLDGEPIWLKPPDLENGFEGENATVSAVIINALLADPLDEKEVKKLTGEDKLRRLITAQMISGADSDGYVTGLTAENITEIKKLVGERNSTLVSGLVWQAIDPPETS